MASSSNKIFLHLATLDLKPSASSKDVFPDLVDTCNCSMAEVWAPAPELRDKLKVEDSLIHVMLLSELP